MKSSISRRLPTMLEHRIWEGWMAVSGSDCQRRAKHLKSRF